MATAISIPLNVVYLRSTCPELVAVEVLNNDIIKIGDFSSCSKGVTVSKQDKSNTIANAFSYDCRELEGKLREHHIFRRKTIITLIPAGCYGVYNHTNESNYFANAMQGYVSVEAIATSNAEISVCLFDSEDDYRHNKYTPGILLNNKERHCEHLMHVSAEQKRTNFPIFDDTPSKYYFVTICTDKELSYLEYTFITTRKYYNNSDFAMVNDNYCRIPIGGHQCCVMLNVTPFNTYESNYFSNFSLHGNNDGSQNIGYVILYILASICFVLFSVTCFFSCFRVEL